LSLPVAAVKRIAAVAALCAASPAWGAFTSLDSQAPSAQVAGLGGAQEAGVPGSAAAVGNPAAFAHGESAVLSLSGGNGGSSADGVGAAWLDWPVEDDLDLGLAYEDTEGALGPGFSEQSVGLSAGLAAAEHLGLGVRGWLLQAGSAGLQGSAQGFSLDAGARSDWNLSRRDTLSFGITGENMASAWPDRFWQQSVPLTTRAGMGWSRSGLAWAGLQFEVADSGGAGVPPRQGYRFGIESQAFKTFQIRAGASTFPDQALSAGASLPFTAWGLHGVLHYAAVLDEQWQTLRHRVQLDFSYRVLQRSEIFAVPLQVVFEPGTKHVKSARISLNVDAAGESAQEWELEIRDKNGNVVRVLRGTGVPPAFVTWDGKDALGQSIEDGDQVSYRLNIKTATGLRSSKDAFATEASLNTEGLNELAIPSSSEGALVVPVMGSDGRTSQLLLKAPAIPGETQHWEIVIQDGDGNTLKKLEGTGALPSQLLWDGMDDEGRKVADRAGLRIRFNAFDRSGNVSSVDQGLDSGLQPIQDSGPAADEAQARLSLRMPAVREGGPRLEMRLSDASLEPLAIAAPTATPRPTRVPTQRPTLSPTAVPTAVPTASPSPLPSPVPTPVATQEPAVLEAPRPVKPLPETEAASRPLVAGLQAARFLADPNALPPAIMTRAEADARGPQLAVQPSHRQQRPSTLPASVDGILDVFKPGTAEVDEAKYGDKLQAFFWRLQRYKHRRLQLTGLVKVGEAGGENLSRERAREISRRMVEEGGFDGEFILRVDGKAGPEGGVRVQALSR
jgi:hypothetical protein